MSEGHWSFSAGAGAPVAVDLLALRVRVWLRRLGMTIGTTAVIIGVIAGTVMGLAAGARRTASAPDRYTASVGGEYFLSLYQPFGEPLTRGVGGLDGVAEIFAWTYVTAVPLGATGTPVLDPETFAGDDDIPGFRLVAGRFTSPASPDEFTGNRALANLLGAGPGDRFRFAAYDQHQAEGNELDRQGGPAAQPFEATLVGITESPFDFESSSPTLIFSRAFLKTHADVGLVATLMFVRLGPGADRDAVLAAVRSLPGGDQVFAEEATVINGATRRAVDVQVAALLVVTAVAGAGAALVIALLVGKIAGPTVAERSSLSALGSTSVVFRLETAVEATLLTVCAGPFAVLTCLAVSAVFPLGPFRLLEPDPGLRVDPYVLGAGLVITLAVTIAAGISAVQRRTGVRPAPRSPNSLALVAARASASLPLTIGSKLAAEGSTPQRSGGRALLLGALCVAGLMASGIVGVSLLDATSRPARWGANYDELLGNPYVPTTQDLAGPVTADPDLAALTTATIESIPIDALDVSIFATETVRGELGPPVLDGRGPVANDEISLGRETARSLAVGIGDIVAASADDGSTHVLRIVGTSVSPNSAGRGAWMTFAGLRVLRPEATGNLLLVNLRDGAPPGTVDRIADLSLASPNADGLGVPTSVKALERVVPAPFMLALVLALLLIVATAYRLVLSVRSRRHDLAVLRALGADPAQLRRAVHWHATLISAGALAIGLPVGIVAGRSVMTLVTDSVGIVPGTTAPAAALVGACVATVAMANVIAALPADRAAGSTRAPLPGDAENLVVTR